MTDGAIVYFAAISPLFVAWGAAEVIELARKRRLQHNPKPIKVTSPTLKCRKCRRWAPHCTCWNGPAYEEVKR